MKIVVFDTEEWEHAACRTLTPDHEVACLKDALSDETAGRHADAEVVSTFINSTLNARVLARLPNLRLIATRSTGYDHIDLGYCADHGVTVCNVPDYGDSTVAEHTFALLLAAVRNILPAAMGMRRGDLSARRGIELRGKTLGVIGTGRVGRRVIEIARGFGMDVIASDSRPDHGASRRLGFTYAPLSEVVALADVLTLHVPATPATTKLISDREFAAMKPGAVLVNTSRGSVVDVAALVRALADKKLRAAALDVLSQETVIREEAEIFRSDRTDAVDLKELVASHVLLQYDNVIVTPHMAYATEEAVHRIIDTTVENILSFASGTPRNIVSLPSVAVPAA